jgi:protein-L-isoaspartate(D-aspartate) O-methyltransferase
MIPPRIITCTEPQPLSLNSEQWRTERQDLIEEQIRQRGINNPAVLKAMLTVPRHHFIKPPFAQLAYADLPVPIGYGQTISQPFIVAYMTEMAELTSEKRVLEIGTGCGYQTAILAEIALEVYSIEIVPQLAESARQILTRLGYTNVHLKIGDGYQGWPNYAPFDAIVVTAAPDHIPQPLIDQMAMNATMVIPVGKEYQTLMLLKKTAKGLVEKKTLPVIFVPLKRQGD